MSPLILASGSPRRQEFLQILGLDFRIVVSNTEEPLFAGGDPSEYVMEVSETKARIVSRSHPEHWVLGADTVVVINGKVLGKPRTTMEAAVMLEQLSGRWHEVYSGFCIVHQETGALVKEAVRSRVRMRELSAAEIASYVATGEPMDKAGGYAIQGIGAFMVDKIEGSYTNVVGLPLSELVDAMEHRGIIRPCVASE